MLECLNTTLDDDEDDAYMIRDKEEEESSYLPYGQLGIAIAIFIVGLLQIKTRGIRWVL